MNWKIEKLLNGETIISKESGNSMIPLIQSKQPVMIEPTNWNNVNIGDIVYCKVKGKFYTHLVKAIDNNKGCLIENNKGRINGWTKNIYGKVIKIL
jgi:phage repressor protein C with HTH and peptisase S24 domain